MRHILGAVFGLAVLPWGAVAEDGSYFGIGASLNYNLAVSDEVPTYEAKAFDGAVALTAGYAWSLPDGKFWGVEGNLDWASGKILRDDGRDACTNVSPDWCNINAVARLRATYGMDLPDGTTLIGAFGLAAVKGRLEVNPDEYEDSVGTGISFGIGWEKPFGTRAIRLDANFDHITKDNNPTYPRQLDIVGLRLSYMF